MYVRSNISSAAGASDWNSRHMAPSINVFHVDVDYSLATRTLIDIFTSRVCTRTLAVPSVKIQLFISLHNAML